MTSPHLYKLTYDPFKDLAPVTMLATAPVFVWVDAKSPYRTLADLVVDAKARQGQLNYSSSAPAVLATRRNPLRPEVPCLAESGYPGIEGVPILNLMAPAGTPPALIARLNEHARRALESPEVRAKLSALYFDVSDGGDPAAVGAWLRAESAKWGEVIRVHGLKVE